MKITPKAIIPMVVSACLAGGPVLAAQGTVAFESDSRINVRFISPENFTDVRESWGSTDEKARDHILGQLRDHLRKQGERYLAEGLHLTIHVTDVDLAGDFEPWLFRHNEDIRVVKDLYPARIKLEFQLTDSAGTVLAEGERRLNSFGRTVMILPSSETLRHEKELLRDWIVSEFREFRKR